MTEACLEWVLLLDRCLALPTMSELAALAVERTLPLTELGMAGTATEEVLTFGAIVGCMSETY